jgi:hypothetical protein
MFKYLTNSLDLNPSRQAAGSKATQELPSILWNLKDYYRVHRSRSPPLVAILSQINPIHTTTSYLLKIHLNIIRPRLRSGIFPSGVPINILRPIPATCPANLILFDFIARIVLDEEFNLCRS